MVFYLDGHKQDVHTELAGRLEEHHVATVVLVVPEPEVEYHTTFMFSTSIGVPLIKLTGSRFQLNIVKFADRFWCTRILGYSWILNCYQ